MRIHELTWPEIGLIAGTRAALGAGVGLLIAPRLNRDQRRTAGWVLLSVGLITTVPLIARVFGPQHRRLRQSEAPYEPVLSI